MQDFIVWLKANPPAFAAVAGLFGGLIAAAVGILTAWLSHYFTAKREATRLAADERREAEKVTREAADSRRAVLRERLERVFDLIQQHVSYLEEEQRQVRRFLLSHSYGIPSKDEEPLSGMSALDQAKTLCTLYFPTLLPQHLRLREASNAQHKFHREEFALHKSDPAGWKDGPANTLAERISHVDKLRLVAVGEFELAGRKLIEEELLPVVPTH